MTPPSDDILKQARQRVAEARTQPGGIAVLTGAGMSAESGIPTFRDALTGHWARFDPMELASEDGFRADPQRVWDWYAERREGVRRAQPNAGHHALAALAADHPGVMTLVTQNVDNLHQRAGNADTIRLHGDILEDRWLDACSRHAQGGNVCDPAWAEGSRPPRCADCENPLRPGVVWFGEPLPIQGDGTQSRDFTFVDTVTAVITDAIVRGVTSPEPVNLAFGSRTNLLEVIDLIEQSIGHSVERDFREPRVGDVPHSQAANDRLLALFPDIEPVALGEGLLRTIDWFRTLG